jgi:hypothetical protein
MTALVSAVAGQNDPIAMFAMNSEALRRNQSPFCSTKAQLYLHLCTSGTCVQDCSQQPIVWHGVYSSLLLTFLNFSSVSSSKKRAPTKATDLAKATPAWRQQDTVFL